MWLKYSKTKKCLYYIIKYAHTNVVLSKNLGKFYRSNMEELHTNKNMTLNMVN